MSRSGEGYFRKYGKKRKTLSITNHEAPEKKKRSSRCTICKQKIEELRIYPGHPNSAVEEFIALTDPRLSLFTGEEGKIEDVDLRPSNKLTHFSVYDKNGHLCPFDTGLIEDNVLLYFSGYMKAIYEDDPSPSGGISTKDMGPINEWFVSGFDGGEHALLGFSTAYGEYFLMSPSELYEPFIKIVLEKIHMSKVVIEFLLDDENSSYEDLINKLQTVVPPNDLKFTEESLLRHAQFVCDQVMSFDSAANSEDFILITSPCMRSLVNLSGVTLGKRLKMRPQVIRRKSRKILSQATTTRLVSNVFESLFPQELATFGGIEYSVPRRRRCGVCEACQGFDCGECIPCKNMTKFQGSGKHKQACVKRKCANIAIQEANDSDSEYGDEEEEIPLVEEKIFGKLNSITRVGVERKNVKWIGEPIYSEASKNFFSSAFVGDFQIHLQDTVMIELENSKYKKIAKVVHMWENSKKQFMFHANWFIRGVDTILGETANQYELFQNDECDDIPLASIDCKCEVIQHKIAKNWSELGNTELSMDFGMKNLDEKKFFFQKFYSSDSARFQDPPLDDSEFSHKPFKHKFCPACNRVSLKKQNLQPSTFERQEIDGQVCFGLVKYKEEEFKTGTAVYLHPTAFEFKHSSSFETSKQNSIIKNEIDEDIYPEAYRKSSDNPQGSNFDTPDPFCIGYIRKIYSEKWVKSVSPTEIWIEVNKIYRPENTHTRGTLNRQSDFNLVYWSQEICKIPFSSVTGKCYLIYAENLDISMKDWSELGPQRFYFTEAYNSKLQNFEDPPKEARMIGRRQGKFKKRTAITKNQIVLEKPVDYPVVTDKLKTLDVFSGCGGLSEGLRQSGISENLWAIENDQSAAFSYKLNHPNSTVFTDDCNLLLKKVLNDEKIDNFGQKLPQKGEIDLICGGPPCQGFSGMNRFNSRQYSLFKNSLVVSLLSYCDFYRPRFFLMENVRNFAFFKRSTVLKLTLQCLIRMGYQCSFGILQSGNFGVPQTRRRLFIIAAAPGEMLPNFPEPLHVFSKRACRLSVVVDSKNYSTNSTWKDSAPLRTITVHDAISDLPEIKNGSTAVEISYDNEAVSPFQKRMRGKEDKLRDHICKDMAPLVVTRIEHIPIGIGADWRNLPNIIVKMSDGNLTNKLEYNYRDKKDRKNGNGKLRGVCACSTGKNCDPMDRQFNTLIPWCLPHTGNRHHHWPGLYGRLQWTGFFGTTVTNPEPMGKQGRVLHPEQSRLISVRECARSQGFPDCHKFYGTILDKYRQIGNAVPPPLGVAIGHEIRKCVEIKVDYDIDKSG